MGSSPRVSVVVPTYNQAAYLPEALDSILSQSHENWQAVVVNDGSTDNTAAVVDRYAAADPRFVGIHKPNGGVASALNAGLEAADGEYFCWLSSDDLFLHGKLEAQVAAFEGEHRRAGLIVTGYNYIDEHGQIINRVKSNPEAEANAEANLILHGNFINGCTVMIPMPLVRSIGGFSSAYRYAQDYDMWTKVAMRKPIVWLDDVHVSYRVHPGQGSATQESECLVDSCVIIHELLRHYPLPRIMQGFSLQSPQEIDRAMQYLFRSVMWESVWVNSEPLNRVFWEWVAGNLKPRVGDDVTAQILTTIANAIGQSTNNPKILANCRSIEVVLRAIGRMRPFSPAPTKTPDEGRRMGVAQGDRDAQPRVALTVVSGHVRGGGAAVLYRYAAWLQALGVNVTIYSNSERPEWVDLDCRFVTQPDPVERYRSITEPTVVVYAANEILDVEAYAPAGKRIVHLCQGYEGHHYGRGFDEFMRDEPYFGFLHRLPIERIVVSEHLRDLQAKMAESPTYVIENGVDLSVFTPCDQRSPSSTWRVLATGNPTTMQKGIQDLEIALAIVVAQRPECPVHLTLACAHDIYYEPPQNLGFTYELVAALGSHAMHDLYCKTDMFACPSWYEGFSLPVLESMACGVPVVVTENLGTDGWCEDGKNCLRVPNHSPIQLSDAIITLMEDPGLAQRLATAGIESAHVHGLRRQFDEFTEAFERILEVRFDRRLVGELRRTLAV